MCQVIGYLTYLRSLTATVSIFLIYSRPYFVCNLVVLLIIIFDYLSY